MRNALRLCTSKPRAGVDEHDHWDAACPAPQHNGCETLPPHFGNARIWTPMGRVSDNAIKHKAAHKGGHIQVRGAVCYNCGVPRLEKTFCTPTMANGIRVLIQSSQPCVPLCVAPLVMAQYLSDTRISGPGAL